jgi:predicted esterase
MRARSFVGLVGLAMPLVALGCNGVSSTSGRHVLPSSVLAGLARGTSAPGTTATGSGSVTSAPAATPGISPARDAELRPIVDAYVATGDLPTALAALAGKNATPQELLKMLRGPRPAAPLVGGHQSFTITDGNGTSTDLQLVAPPVAEIQARATKGLGLVVLLHGLNGNAGQTVGLATQLAATNEVIACGPSVQKLPAGFQPEDGCPASIAAQFPSWWIYEDAHTFALEAIRKACSLYPIDPERVVLAGASMGGYGTWNIGLRHADRFAAIAPMCGGLTRLGQAGLHDSRSTALLVNGLLFPVWAAHGDADTVVPYQPDQEAANQLKALGGDVTFHLLPGVGHDIAPAIMGTGTLAQELTTFVTTKRRKSLPLTVTYLSAGTTLDGAHWLRMAARTAGLDRAQITGTIDPATNTVALSAANGVDLARVYVDDRILDLSKPVTVTVNGAVKLQKTVAPDLASILESWRSREDEGLVYPAFLEVDPR